MPHAYTEDQVVEQPAIEHLAELGWQTMSSLERAFGVSGWFDHETKAERVLAELLTLLQSSTSTLLLPRLLSGQGRLSL